MTIIEAGRRLSLQFHEHKLESIRVMSGRLLLWDALDTRFRTVKLRRDLGIGPVPLRLTLRAQKNPYEGKRNEDHARRGGGRLRRRAMRTDPDHAGLA